MDIRTIKNRIKAVRNQLKKSRIDALIITKPANVTYTTCFSGHDSWAVITERAAYLVTDSRYLLQARSQCPACTIIQRTGHINLAVADLLKRLKFVRTAGVEASTSLADFKALKKTVKTRLKTAANVVEQLRSIKDKAEIAAITAAANIAAKAVERTKHRIKPGITENQLAGLLEFEIRRLGALNSFETIAAFGANASCAHHQPTNKKLKSNDTVLIDFGVRCKNYCCDLTRCFAVGRAANLYKKVYDVVTEAQAAAIKAVKAGVKIRDVDTAARRVIAESGLPVFGHGTGHGLGLEVHELPVVSDKAKGRLRAGEVVTIEPAVYIPGKLGVRIEDDVLVTETGYRILTRNCPHSFRP